MSTQFDVSLLTAQGLTVGGVEFERESFLDSLRKLMELYLFDCAEIDGKIVFVPRGQASVLTIPEADLGALSDPSQYEPRVGEVIEDERDVPRKVTVKYYDLLKGDQQATQEAKRILTPYPSSLTGAKPNTNSHQEIDIVSPVTDNATPIAQQAEKILNDAISGRFTRKWKLGPKYQRLDPTDVVTLSYRGLLLETRIEECDRGAGGGFEFQGKSQDQSAYTSAAVGTPPQGTTGGTTTPPAPTPSTTYTINPAMPLSEFSATQIDMTNVTASFSPSGLRTFYNARPFTVADPGAGNSQLYYVTIYDPTFKGEAVGTVSLTGFCGVSPASVHLGTSGYIFMGTITITHDLLGVVVTGGGSGNITQAIGFYVNGGGGTGFTTKIDLMSYAAMDSRRASFHVRGSAANGQSSAQWSYVDTATHSFAFVKAPSGWACDILLYASDYLYQFITELDDVGYRDWSINTSYKKLILPGGRGYQLTGPLPIMPRFITPGQPQTVIDVAAPNQYNRYRSCSIIDTLDKGHVTNITYGPVMMNIDSDGTTAGNLGTVSMIVNERYSGARARERFFFGLNLGFLKWDQAYLLSGAKFTGTYGVTNWSVHNQLVAGGGVAANFGCGYGVGWP